jgi:hypothetical protein
VTRARKTPPPALSGLIRQLPVGSWSQRERALFLEAFTRCLDLSVPLSDGLVAGERLADLERATNELVALRGATPDDVVHGTALLGLRSGAHALDQEDR